MTGAIMLMIIFAAGCSTTSDIAIRSEVQTSDEEPFMEDVRELATQRRDTNFYYLGKPIDQAEYDRRVDDIVSTQEQSLLTGYEGQPEVVPVLLLRF